MQTYGSFEKWKRCLGWLHVPQKNGILLCNTKPLSENTKLIRDAEARISSAMVESKVKEEMVGWAQFCDQFNPTE